MDGVFFIYIRESRHTKPLSANCLLHQQMMNCPFAKVALLIGLRQNLPIGQRESTQHDGTVIEWAGSAVLFVQS
jgi:hypothetical protein